MTDQRQLTPNDNIDEGQNLLQNQLEDFKIKQFELEDMAKTVQERDAKITPEFVIKFVKKRELIIRTKVLTQNSVENLKNDFTGELDNRMERRLEKAEKYHEFLVEKYHEIKSTCDEIEKYYANLKKSNYITSAFVNQTQFQDYNPSDVNMSDFGRMKTDSIQLYEGQEAPNFKPFVQKDVIESRQVKIDKLENDAIQVNEVGHLIKQDIFKQDEKVNVLNKELVKAEDNVADAEDEQEEAVAIQDADRKKCYWLIAIISGIVIVAIIVIILQIKFLA